MRTLNHKEREAQGGANLLISGIGNKTPQNPKTPKTPKSPKEKKRMNPLVHIPEELKFAVYSLYRDVGYPADEISKLVKLEKHIIWRILDYFEGREQDSPSPPERYVDNQIKFELKVEDMEGEREIDRYFWMGAHDAQTEFLMGVQAAPIQGDFYAMS